MKNGRKKKERSHQEKTSLTSEELLILMPILVSHVSCIPNKSASIFKGKKSKFFSPTRQFAFSKENWRRPASEVNMLMRLLAKSLTDQLPLFRIHKIRLNVIGDRDQIPRIVSEEINRVELATLDHCGMKLVVAVNYSGQFDIIQAVRRLSQEKESLADVTFQDIQSALLTGASENPDLIIRTGGDTRLSNFYLWQAANSEIHFEEKLWPDFTCNDLDRHLCQFAITERRFGRIGPQLKDVK